MARDDREVIYVERDEGGRAFKWLVLGAALGAGAAFLFAPRAGRDLRRELVKGIKRLRSLADETIDEIRGEPEDEEEKLRAMTDEAWDEDEDELDEEPEVEAVERHPARKPARPSAREELERRLEAARARRRRPADADDTDEEPLA